MVDKLAGFLRRQHVDQPLWHTGFFQQGHQRQHCQRRFRSGLDDHRAPCRQSRRDLAGAHRGRIIPGRDQHGNSGRLVLNNDARARRRRMSDKAVSADGFFGEPAEELGRIGCFAHRIGTGLAVFKRDQPREFLQPFGHQLPGFAEDFRAFARLLRGPKPEGGFRCIECRISVGEIGGGDRCDRFFGRGIDDIKAFAACRVAPLAIDVEIGVLHLVFSSQSRCLRGSPRRSTKPVTNSIA